MINPSGIRKYPGGIVFNDEEVEEEEEGTSLGELEVALAVGDDVRGGLPPSLWESGEVRSGPEGLPINGGGGRGVVGLCDSSRTWLSRFTAASAILFISLSFLKSSSFSILSFLFISLTKSGVNAGMALHASFSALISCGNKVGSSVRICVYSSG